MPSQLLDSRSKFDNSKATLGRWLRGNFPKTKALSSEELGLYHPKDFRGGWSIQVNGEDQLFQFHVLIDGKFPYSSIRIAYKSQEVYLRWPHVETEQGLLCLPEVTPASESVELCISSTLQEAVDLVILCRSPDFVEKEMAREFLSYWNRLATDAAKNVRSLLDLTNKKPRRIFIWRGPQFVLAGETESQVLSWLENFGTVDEPTIHVGVFGYLDCIPLPPFPKTASDLLRLLQRHCEGIDKPLSQVAETTDVIIVTAAEVAAGSGVIAFTLTRPDLNGFRKKKQLPLRIKKQLWRVRSGLQRLKTERFDSNWIHGRGLDDQHLKLHNSNVIVLGAGSLGSQVVTRLAQCGVGGVTIVDPEGLDAANVGRHSLGINSVDKSKAIEIAHQLRRRFPHMRQVEGVKKSWQVFCEENAGAFYRADLIVACIGEWSEDGQLGEWYARSGRGTPIVYGWLDERGTASHAVALVGKLPALNCILDSSGVMRGPESIWPADMKLESEPACGTSFQPYGPLDVVYAESLVTKLCLDILVGSIALPIHRVFAGPSSSVSELGGQWTKEHLDVRPAGYEGPFEYERPVTACGVCVICEDAK